MMLTDEDMQSFKKLEQQIVDLERSHQESLVKFPRNQAMHRYLVTKIRDAKLERTKFLARVTAS